MQSVDVLGRVDRLLDGELVDVLRHGQLHDDAVDLGVAVQAAERGVQLALGHVDGHVDLFGTDPDVGARLVLGADVDAGRLVVADQDGGQSGGHAALGERAHPIGDLGADLAGDRLPIQDASRHGAESYLRRSLSDGSGAGR